jgi:hypothetical protein
MTDPAKGIITAIRAECPELTRWGFWSASEDGFEAARAEMTSQCAIKEFERACQFLAQHCKRRQTCSKFSSYGWKHRAEIWFREVKGERQYVSNGMFIAGAIANGFKIERLPCSPNCRVNISRTSWFIPERVPQVPQCRSGTHFSIEAYHARACYPLV